MPSFGWTAAELTVGLRPCCGRPNEVSRLLDVAVDLHSAQASTAASAVSVIEGFQHLLDGPLLCRTDRPARRPPDDRVRRGNLREQVRARSADARASCSRAAARTEALVSAKSFWSSQAPVRRRQSSCSTPHVGRSRPGRRGVGAGGGSVE